LVRITVKVSPFSRGSVMAGRRRGGFNGHHSDEYIAVLREVAAIMQRGAAAPHLRDTIRHACATAWPKKAPELNDLTRVARRWKLESQFYLRQPEVFDLKSFLLMVAAAAVRFAEVVQPLVEEVRDYLRKDDNAQKIVSFIENAGRVSQQMQEIRYYPPPR
jgi:hypothetical protein